MTHINGVDIQLPGGSRVVVGGIVSILAVILAGVLAASGYGVWHLIKASSTEHRQIINSVDMNTCMQTLTEKEKLDLRSWAKSQKDFKYYCPWLKVDF